MPDDIPGRQRPMRAGGQGAPVRRPKPVKSIGRRTRELYCPGCGHLKKKCICPPLHKDTAQQRVHDEARADRFLDPPDPADFPER